MTERLARESMEITLRDNVGDPINLFRVLYSRTLIFLINSKPQGGVKDQIVFSPELAPGRDVNFLDWQGPEGS